MTATVAEVLAQTIKAAGVEIVFGLPGGENVEVMEALRQQGLRFVLVRNESSALFMADANARLTGKPGVCLTTLGPGAANALVGLAHAYLDRAPVLIITAQTNESYLPDYTHQVLDLAAIFQPVTKFSADFSHIAAAYGLDFYRAANEAACAEAVQAAVAAGRPALLEALIDPVGYPTTPGTV